MQKQRKTTKATTSELILEALREQIINGTLVPQEKLVEAEIAQQFGTSRGPVRDALKQLAVEGMVDYQPNKGCSVARLSPEDAYEVFFLRGSLEKLAIQKSNCHVSDYGLLIMETSIEEFRIADEAGNLMQAVRADEKFHQQIVQSAQIDRLTKMWELLSPLNGAMFLSVRNANRFGNQISDSETLAEAEQPWDRTDFCWKRSERMIYRKPASSWICIMKRPANAFTGSLCCKKKHRFNRPKFS